jgi:NAD(P)-dependent dehydrogenase (short-subunit alcohol dehydrogenase family)
MLDLSRFSSMEGRVCLVTGATSGHGLAVARGLCLRGADVILLGRSPERCRATREQLARETGRRPDVLLCDLARREEIDRAAEEFLRSGRPLHVLVNNAGLVNRRRIETPDGREMVFAVNYLAQFQLTLRLLRRLQASAPARVVNVSSDTHRVVALRLHDLEHRHSYSLMGSYGRSKLAIAHFTLELARRMAGSGVTVNAVDPGPVASRIGMNNPGLAADVLALVMRLFFPSADRAARTALQLASDPELHDMTGRYFKFGEERPPRLDTRDPDLGARLWELSERLVQLDRADIGGADCPGEEHHSLPAAASR